MSASQNKILVAIYCIVYNHEPYLRDCLEGFVMQKTNFSFVAVVHDDASTDKSADVIREYAEKYPEIILPIYETENLWSKHNGSIDRIVYKTIDSIGAKYVAMCEGDDFWIDPYKLQKQVDYMEAHPNCSCCAHNSLCLNTQTSEIRLFNRKIYGIQDYTLDTFLVNGWFTPTASLLYKREAYLRLEDLPSFIHGDYTILLNILLKEGSYLHYDNQIMSVYRDGGWASSHYEDRQVELCDDFIALLQYFKDKSNHRCDSIFDSCIAKQNEYKSLLIKQKKEKQKSRGLLSRMRKIARKLLS